MNCRIPRTIESLNASYQPRKIFTEEAIKELKDSIIQHGIIQPIIVKKSIKGYDIVVGERRFRAAKLAGLNKVPVVIKDFTNQQMMELAVLENVQREDLTPIEEAFAYQTLLDKLDITQEELANRLGKSRRNDATIASVQPSWRGPPHGDRGG